jgi:hypothetical protein
MICHDAGSARHRAFRPPVEFSLTLTSAWEAVNQRDHRRGPGAAEIHASIDSNLATYFIIAAINAISDWYRPEGTPKPADGGPR